jgi:hypothetical protein
VVKKSNTEVVKKSNTEVVKKSNTEVKKSQHFKKLNTVPDRNLMKFLHK